ncbi:hypothetical protein VNI00_007079 [Paramarasmius palmivorus]|uniref:CCR4-NOT transcription complex subunit 11 n=1 Tax=Paramarasmius palmivorus TaxID=297713 RepID=A0AAW0D553_9AGAR
MSSVLTSKLPGINPAFLSSHLLNAGNRNVVMYQHEPVGSPGFGVGIGSGGSGSPLGVDPVRAAVAHLFSKAYSLPCSTAAHSFANLVQPTSRFQLALDALLPILEQNTSTDLAQRILVSFILYSLYAPHPITINPFKSVLFSTFVKERDKAVNVASSGGVAANEPFVWVLWKILKGDGNDIGPYSPTTLARSPLPPKLRATNLFLDDELYHKEYDMQVTSTFNKHPADFIHRDDYSYITKPETRPSSTDRIGGPYNERLVSPEEDQRIAQAMQLLLAARERVLTLSEQRIVLPMIQQLANSRMVTPYDLAPIISYNSTLAHPLFVALIARTEDDDATMDELISRPQSFLPSTSPYLDVLCILPPTLATFDLMGRLLRDQTPLANGVGTLADLIKEEVLGGFVHECILWLERAEREEREGLISDDRFAKGLQNLCRFYHSLIKLSIVNPGIDSDSAEMMHFSLKNSRFEDANALYRALVMGGRAAY